MKKCFVISPIGGEGTDIRKDADNVFNYIINPAMKACNIEAFRSDHLDKPGKISEQMFQAIYNSDLCIADLTSYNPNVFYELAVAQSANRPVIILIRKGQLLPFDVSDLRSIHYDLEISSYDDKTYINKIVNYVKEFEEANWKVQDLFASFKVKQDTALHEMEFLDSSADYGTNKTWNKLVEDTVETFDVMGIGLLSYRSNEIFKDTLLGKAYAGCKVRILMVHEEHPLLAEVTTNFELMKNTLPHTYVFFNDLSKQNPNIEVRRITKGLPNVFLTISDQYAVIIQYLKSTKWGSGPLWKCTPSSPLYKIAKKEFKTFWNSSISDTEKS